MPDMPSLGAAITDTERGLATTTSLTTPSLRDLPHSRDLPGMPIDDVGAILRLGRVADMVFRERGWTRLRDISFPSDPNFIAILNQVYQSEGLIEPPPRPQRKSASDYAAVSEVLEARLDRIRELYRQDLSKLADAIRDHALGWVFRALEYNRGILEVMEADFLDPAVVAELHSAAGEYLRRKELSIHRGRTSTSRTAPALEELEKIRHIERSTLETLDSSRMEILFAQPQRHLLFDEMAESESAATQALRHLFAEARDGMEGLLDEFASSPEHVWRYPPIITGAVALIVSTHAPLSARSGSLLKFSLNLARDRAGSAFGDVAFVAGTAVTAVALAWNPLGWALVALKGIDLIISGLGAYLSYRQELQNDMADAAAVLRQGVTITDRASNYGPALLEGAAALLVGIDLAAEAASVVRIGRSAGTTKLSKLESPSETNARLTQEAGVQKQFVGDTGIELPEAEPIGELLERNAALNERSTTPKGMEERAIKTEARVADAPATTTLRQKPLKALGYDRARSKKGYYTGKQPPLESVEDFLRSVTAYGRHPPVPLNEAERALFQRVGLDRWEAVVSYARSNASSPNAVFKLKGKIQEILIDLLPEFRTIEARALERARALGVQPRSVRFVRGLSERSRELGDAALIGIRSDPVNGDRAVILAFFESKGKDNIRDLVTSLDGPGQFALDLRRLQRDSVTIGARTFEPSHVDVGEFTEFYAVLPQGKSLSADQISSILGDIPNVHQVQSTVRDEALQGIAAGILKRLRFE